VTVASQRRGGGAEVQEAGTRVEELLAELTGTPAYDKAEELVRCLVQLYGAGLTRITELAGPDVVNEFAADEMVSALLVLHDLHPLTTDERVTAALDKVRPYLGSHAGGVEYLGIDEDGMAMLRLEGSCDGCPSSQLTVTMAIETALKKAAPEVMGVTVEGVVSERESKLLQIHPYQGKECAVPQEATT
jgi:Fe-S cluster biogenesis protein NfuA